MTHDDHPVHPEQDRTSLALRSEPARDPAKSIRPRRIGFVSRSGESRAVDHDVRAGVAAEQTDGNTRRAQRNLQTSIACRPA